jgi:hypothetical protein
MIYEETYQYLLRNVSSTEFDTCLYALLHSDWDGVIQSPLHMMARGIGTTEKYLRQIIHKFTAPQGSLKKVFVPVHQGEDVYTSLTLDLQVILTITGTRTVIARNTVSFIALLSKP